MTATFPCPCCGFLVFSEPAGSFDICPLCAWEDDSVQLEAPGYPGGANRDSLCQAQRRGGWDRLDRDLFQGYRRAPGWRPLRDEECTRDAPRAESASQAADVYYWQRSRPAS